MKYISCELRHKNRTKNLEDDYGYAEKKKIRSLFLVDIGQVHVQYTVMFTVRHSWYITSDRDYIN